MRIKELREQFSLSQERLALEIQTSQRNIGRWENGENEPTYSQLIKLADFFGCSVDYLIGREDDFGNVSVSSSQSDLSKDEKTLLERFRKLGPFERESILVQIDALSSEEYNARVYGDKQKTKK